MLKVLLLDVVAYGADSVLDRELGLVELRLPGAAVFHLHDTYGFPIDLTVEIAAERRLEVDVGGFRRLMNEQRQRAKQDAQAEKRGHADLRGYLGLLVGHGPTEWLAYQQLAAESSVVAILRDGPPVASANEGEIVGGVLDRTPFYAECSGQGSDAGGLTGASFAPGRCSTCSGRLRGSSCITSGSSAARSGSAVKSGLMREGRPGAPGKGLAVAEFSDEV
ncbi:alanine--tRNA ligase-related protein [Nonomuraea angiospora]|uniref:alanine--tRNA ligase-related protein n=1 Tax=Nonomuraea angiospora TaxID=46172 RepID=UPI00332326D1